MILHPIIKVRNILRFEAKDGDGDMGKNMVSLRAGIDVTGVMVAG